MLSSASCFTASLFLVVGWWTGKGAEPQLINGQSGVQIVIYAVILAVSTLKLTMTTIFSRVNQKLHTDVWRIFTVQTDPTPPDFQNSIDLEVKVRPLKHMSSFENVVKSCNYSLYTA